MAKITKEDVKKAFLLKTGKRNHLLYTYYREEYFTDSLPASFIAEKISEDLGIPITRTMIYMVHHRIIKKQKNLPAPLPSAATSNLNPVTSSQVTESKENETEDSVESREERLKKKYNWTNKDDEPKKDEMYEAFKNRGLIK